MSGVFIGIIMGALPGLTVAMAIAVFLPFTFGMTPELALMLLMGIYAGGMYGGSISAILVNIPGTAGAIATNLDGYPMAQKGLAGQAIGMATVGSFIGGMIGFVVLMMMAPPIAKFALKFGPPEYFALAIFGLTIIAGIAGKSFVKGIIGGTLGLFFGIIGLDPITNVPRFTFGNVNLFSGLEFVPVMIGIFGLSEALDKLSVAKVEVVVQQKLGSVIPKMAIIRQYTKTAIRSSVIGVLIGALPVAGGSVASLVSYNEAKRASKDPESFGTGNPEGVFAAETANNAAIGGALIPCMTFGIPGDAITAVLLGAFMIHNLQPGPLLFTGHPDIVGAMFIALALGTIGLLVLGLSLARFFAKVITMPLQILLPIVTILCVVGSYSLRNSMYDVYVLLVFGLIGLFMKKVSIPPGAVILGLILGPMAEQNLRQALITFDGNWALFMTRPIAVVILLIALISVTIPVLIRYGFLDNLKKRFISAK
jgi:putative tricarboxylic transport membrane protein